LNILINALSARLGGGQTYLRNLIRNAPASGYHIYLLCLDSLDISEMPDNIERLAIDGDLSNPYKRAIWENIWLGKLAQSLSADLLFCPGGLLPRLALPENLRTAVTFQNMLPFDIEQRKRYPLGSRRIRDWILERELASSMLRADLVIFISNFAAQFIQSYLGHLNGQSVIIPHGIDNIFIKSNTDTNYKNEFYDTDEYYLYVSHIDYYKSQIEVAQAFAKLKHENILPGKLVFVGSGYEPYQVALRKEILRLGIESVVTFKGNIPHDQLPGLYQNARINIFASRTENCPNILFEMMASGRPALVSNCGPMPEFAGSTVKYFDPSDTQSLITAWRDAVNNWGDMEVKARAAQSRISNSTWEVASKETWNALANVVRG
jgi:glycosyltransferase involved in cell wall biosynthesis